MSLPFIIVAAVIGFLFGGCASAITDQQQQILDQIAAVDLRDVQQAQQWALYNEDQAAIPCWSALYTVISMVQQMPKPIVVGTATATQMMMDLTSPTGKLQMACASEKAAVKARIDQIVGGAFLFSPAGIGL